MSFVTAGNVNRCTEDDPSIPAYKYWLLSEIARTSGLLPAGTEDVMAAVVGLRTEIVLPFAAAVPGTDR